MSATVQVADNFFSPASVTLGAGGTVTWVWAGKLPHDVSGDGYTSGIQTTGSYSTSFSTPGAYDYHCEIHPTMRGRVTVQ